MRQYRLGVDIGGTFTDIIVLGGEDGGFDRLVVGKTLTTPADPSIGAIRGITSSLKSIGIAVNAVSEIVHGTTLVANAIIERKGARTGLLVTQGFVDVLDTPELRYDLYDLFLERPEPLVPRQLRHEITERMASDGSVLVPLNLDEVRGAVRSLVDQRVTSIGVCFLHSYENPAHEKVVKRLISDSFPGIWVSTSADLLPEIREYTRMSTTVANAFVKPLVDQYLVKLLNSLKALGYLGPLHLMLSSGGITSTEVAREDPIRLIESGPAAGVIAAAYMGDLTGHGNVISFDMGGTTAKMSLVNDAQPTRSNEFEAARLQRFKAGSGLAIRTPVVRLLEIGAGGGSIARIDEMRLLKVGPESSGADPGPACYGRGGTQPTVTDADLLLGHLNPDWFLGGEMPLDVEAARRAIEEHIATPLSVGVLEAAAGIAEVVNYNMATAARVHTAERGRDPRNYAMVAFGGAGPVHGERIAELLGVRRILFPLASGALSALGLLVAPTSFEFSHTYVTRLQQIDGERLRHLFEDMETEGRQILSSVGTAPEEVRVARTAEMRYAGQGFSVTVPLPEGHLDKRMQETIYQAFLDAYRSQYKQAPTNVAVEAINWQLTVSGPLPSVNLMVAERHQGSKGQPLRGVRPIYVARTRSVVEARVLDWYALENGFRFEGPAVVESRESTAIIGPGAAVLVDEFMNLVVDLPTDGVAPDLAMQADRTWTTTEVVE